jgi:two-component system catabolic regulation response regulator CreB
VPKRILVIEDEPAIADTITYALGTEGFEPVWRATGREGLAALAAGPVDLIILDVMLPDASGFEVCKDIRRKSAVPVIFLTARSAEVDRVVGLEIGGDDYVVKPFSPRELVARVKAVLRRSAEGASAPARTSRKKSPPFAVDAERCAIAYCGRRLELSRYEYKILKILVERPGWVYSRDKLMDLAWADPGASTERTVDAHIKAIRAKLRAVRAEPDPIITHRGIGYSLREDW